jgi:hypothetical protein
MLLGDGGDVCMEAKTQISLSVKEIYDRLCPKCKKALKDLIKDKLTDQMVEQMLTKET